jgi:nucleoside phosphorylase
MRILIVDDTPKRYRSLVTELEGVGVSRDDIDFVQSTNDARDKLDSQPYDLMVLDVLVPLRVGEEEHEQHSLDLLTEINGGGLVHAPTQIVGITADESAADRTHQVFASQLWTLIRYREENADWIVQIVNCVAYLQLHAGQQPEAPQFGTDVAIICALPEPELTAIRNLDWSWQPARPIDDSTFVYDGRVPTSEGELSVVACAAPRMGMVSTALLAAKIIDLLRPRILVMAGICAGVRSKVSIGDVLLADPSWDWQSGKRTRDMGNAQFSVAPHQLPAPASVRAHVEQIAADTKALEEIAGRWAGTRPGAPRVKPGPVASGSAVLADGEVIDLIKDQHRELCGIEMEAYGLYAAAHVASSPRPTTFALKSVCDFADEAKSDDYQAYAAYTSASVLDLLLRRYGKRLLPT